MSLGLKKTARMMLIDVNPIEFIGKKTGEVVEKVKHTFMVEDKTNPDGFGFVEYYLPKGQIQLVDWVVSGEDGYHDYDAHDWPMVGKLWDGKVKWTITGEPPKKA